MERIKGTKEVGVFLRAAAVVGHPRCAYDSLERPERMKKSPGFQGFWLILSGRSKDSPPNFYDWNAASALKRPSTKWP